jgi:hypothetical protein
VKDLALLKFSTVPESATGAPFDMFETAAVVAASAAPDNKVTKAVMEIVCASFMEASLRWLLPKFKSRPWKNFPPEAWANL